MSSDNNIKQVIKRIKKQQKLILKSARQALNKTQRTVVAEIVKESFVIAGLQKTGLKKVIKKFRVTQTGDTLLSQIVIPPYAPNLVSYKGTKQYPAKRSRNGKLIEPGGLIAKVYGKKRRIKGGFIANQNRTAFIRISRKRLKIIALRGPSARRLWLARGSSKKMLKVLHDTATGRFDIEFQRAYANNLRQTPA